MQNNKRFTVIELISVMLIILVITVMIVPRIIDLGGSVERKLLGTVLAELNAGEQMAWLDCKISDSPCVPEAKIDDLMGVSINGKGKKMFAVFAGGGKYQVHRLDPTDTSAAMWGEGKPLKK